MKQDSDDPKGELKLDNDEGGASGVDADSNDPSDVAQGAASASDSVVKSDAVAEPASETASVPDAESVASTREDQEKSTQASDSATAPTKDAAHDAKAATESVAASDGAARARARKPRRQSSSVKAQATKSKSSGSLSRLLMVAIGLLGAGVGWLARDTQARAAARADEVAAAEGAGPCQDWEQQVCEGTGATSAACVQAKGAVELLPAAACGTALSDVPATLAKVKAARAECDQLITKLCQDLGEETDTCKMVRERTASFPTERCGEMTKNYDAVLGQLKMMQQRSGGPPGAGPHGRPPGPPPGALPPRPVGGAALKPAVATPAKPPLTVKPPLTTRAALQPAPAKPIQKQPAQSPPAQ